MYQVGERRHIKLSHDKVKHSEEVANYMYDYSLFFDVDSDIAYFTGLNHDIGYVNGRENHCKNGEFLLTHLGLDKGVIDAIKFHGTNPYTLAETDITPLMQLLWCADMSVDKFGKRVGFDERLKDIENRYSKDSIAYNTAHATVSYCKKILKEKTEVKNTDFEIFFSQLYSPKGFELNLNVLDDIFYLKEFGINTKFLDRYCLPVPTAYIRGSINDEGKAYTSLYLRMNPSNIWETIKNYLKNKNTEGINKLIGIKEEQPHEFYVELLETCDNIKYAYIGENKHTHKDTLNKIVEEKYKEFIIFRKPFREELELLDSLENMER